jgi:hypothetical protein
MGVRLIGRILHREWWRFIEGCFRRFLTVVIIIVVGWPAWWYILGQFVTQFAESAMAVTCGAQDS